MKVQITNGMFMALIINMLYAKSIGMTQGIMAREVGGDMWISTIISSVQGIVIMAVVILAIKRLPNGDMIDQYEKILGKWISKGIALLVFLFFLGAYGSIMATFVYHLKDYFLPESNIILFIVAAFLIGTYAIHFGLEVIARMALIGVFSVMALNILLLAGSISEFDIKELQPTFSSGFVSTVWASRHHDTDWAIATMMTCMILPLVRDNTTWIRSSTAGLIFSGVIIVMWPILEVGVLSPEVAAQYIVSCMQMARSAEIGLFLHRYEMIMIAFFALSILTQIMMTFLCSSIAVQKIIGLKDYRPVIIPVGIVLSAFSYWMVGSHHRAMGIIENEWVLVSLSLAIGLPGMLFVLGAIFKKKLKKDQQAKSV